MKKINFKNGVILSFAFASMSLIPSNTLAIDNNQLNNAIVYNIVNNEILMNNNNIDPNNIEDLVIDFVPSTAGERTITDIDDISSMLNTFSDLNIKVLVTEDTRLVRDHEEDLNDDDNHFSYVKKGDILTIVGENDKFYKVAINSYFVYISKDKVTTDVKDIKKEESSTVITDEKPVIVANTWNGPKLNKRKGVNHGPSGKETYYNLPMGGVIKTMRRKGNTDKYWVRADGCKMLGDYIMVAANLKVRPRGSIVETSLGKGIVCDTGGFAKRNIYQIDIATNW